MAAHDQCGTRIRHPALRKTSAINDETVDEDPLTNESHCYDCGDVGSVTQTGSTSKRSSASTATVVCTKSEPLNGDVGITSKNAHHPRSALTIHAHSVPPMRASRLHDMSAMNAVSSFCTLTAAFLNIIRFSVGSMINEPVQVINIPGSTSPPTPASLFEGSIGVRQCGEPADFSHLIIS